MMAIERRKGELPAWLRIFRNAGSSLAGNAAGEVLTTYAVALAAISMGPAGFGRLTEAQAFIEPFDTLAGFGLLQVSVTMAAARGSCDGALRSTVMGLRLCFTFATVALAFGAAVLTGRSSLFTLLMILSVASFVAPFSQASTLPFQCNQTMHRLIGVPFVASVVRLGTAYLAFWFLCNPAGFLLSSTITAAFGAVLLFLVARRYYSAELRFDPVLAKRLVSIAWPAAISEFIIMAYCRGSYFLLHSAGPVVQGEFAAADKLVRPILSVAGAVIFSSLPTVAAIAAKHEYVKLLRVYYKSVVRVVAILVPVTAAAWVGMPWLLRRFAPAYAGASISFRILAVGAVFMFLNQLSSAFIVALGKFRMFMWISLANFAVYFGVALYLIPRYKAPGAAFATASMECVNTLMQATTVAILLRGAIRRQRANIVVPLAP